MSTTPDVVGQLVDKFRTNADHYTSPAYNETLCRVDFINPMFEALGWDMANRAGYSDAYRDVIHEDAIKIGGATKAPDYCFRIGGTRKFFLEGKKPGVDLKNNPDPAYQLRRYAWSAKLPLSILTDFQEFAVYDCRVRPDKQDKPSTARVFYCTCDDYVEQWDKIASIFARESVLKGSFDRYAETARGKRGTAEVDAAFLKEYVREFPVRRTDESSKTDKAMHDKIVILVEQMLSLHRELSAAKNGHAKEALQRQIDATDRQIDRLVYELYGLTEDEIRIVEEASG